MLRTYVVHQGANHAIEVHLPPEGQTLGAPQQARRAHLWWDAGALEREDLPGFQALTAVVPGADHVVLGRSVPGRDWEKVMDAVVVECGVNGQMVQVTVEEVVRTQPPAPPVPHAPPVTHQGQADHHLRDDPGVSGFFSQAQSARESEPSPQ